MENFKVERNIVHYILIAILSVSFCFKLNHVFAQKVMRSNHYFSVNIEENKSFILGEEVDVGDYYDLMLMIKTKYGKDSEQYRFLIPDTVKYRMWYGFSFPFPMSEIKGRGDRRQRYLRQLRKLPMVAISYEQAVAYCQWQDSIINRFSKSYRQYSLPTKADYEMSLKKAKITARKSLSTLQVKHTRKRIFGLTDNIAEYTQDGMIVLGDENTALKFVDVKDVGNVPIGFRYKYKVVIKK
ncbi:MAG: formylglycine-generating enzyme family protein [Bacteroidales bacterium]|jgi:hypothetical protein|nr:formylglycine-generating enzyme family protein [Bacteroidales bacterium]